MDAFFPLPPLTKLETQKRASAKMSEDAFHGLPFCLHSRHLPGVEDQWSSFKPHIKIASGYSTGTTSMSFIIITVHLFLPLPTFNNLQFQNSSYQYCNNEPCLPLACSYFFIRWLPLVPKDYSTLSLSQFPKITAFLSNLKLVELYLCSWWKFATFPWNQKMLPPSTYMINNQNWQN